MSDIVRDQLTAAASAPAIDDRTAAALAAAAYKSFLPPFPAGWDLILRKTDDPGGYDGLVIHHPASRTLVIANRGTEFTSLKDWWQNIGAAIIKAPGPQIYAAQKLVKDGLAAAGAQNLNVGQVLFAGHSLGGALAEAQAILSPSLLPDGLKGSVRAVGVASAGFGEAVKAFAKAYGMTPRFDLDGIVTHYVRRRDAVPNHPGRKVWGKEAPLASIFQAGQRQGHKDPMPHWFPDVDLLANHSSTLHLQFWDVPGDRHIWFSRGGEAYAPRDGDRPG
jgi:hypothetical protein